MTEHDPRKNPKAISLVQEQDGNWRGWMQRFDKVVSVRAGSPETVLQMLLTHNGNEME